ncbi:hypothetical protein CEXT_473661 [Caerostris extrusa]|uniref:Maturase K n=1 Tax=Caerostris extrusa TaxID=172846 RepID=A0AAV4RLY9_CAEEX|nr:hypothetical protein CEXT_473661 [Caerostris extrusa]
MSSLYKAELNLLGRYPKRQHALDRLKLFLSWRRFSNLTRFNNRLSQYSNKLRLISKECIHPLIFTSNYMYACQIILDLLHAPLLFEAVYAQFFWIRLPITAARESLRGFV